MDAYCEKVKLCSYVYTMSFTSVLLNKNSVDRQYFHLLIKCVALLIILWTIALLT